MITEDTPLQTVMTAAWENGILVPAFNIAYIPMVKAVVDTLERLRTFGLLEVARPDVQRFGAKSFARVAQEHFGQDRRAFVRLHLDHIPVIDEENKDVDWETLITECLDLKYDSVMIDGSRCTLDRNIEATRRVVELASPRGVPVEAELGAVLGHEAGPLPPYEELFRTGKGFTEPDQARRFVEETGVSWLSVAIGHVHGAISGAARDQAKVTARLNIEHLRTLREVTGVPLVLHGGSGIDRSYVLEAIQNGITKINIGTSIRQAYERSLRDAPDDIPAAQNAVAETMTDLIRNHYQIEGSWDRLNQYV